MEDVDGLDAGHGTEEIEISSTLKMWIMWARSSRARMEEATAVHRQLVDAVNTGANPSQLLDAEACAVLVGTTSAVFAIEGISRSLGKQVVDGMTLTPEPPL